MILRVKNRVYDFFDNAVVSLKYNAIASTFSMGAYFNPDNEDHKALMRPCDYAPVEIEHDGELLLTGTLLSHSFSSEAKKGLVALSGYSKTGVLEDSDIPLSIYPLQSDGLAISDIARKLIRPFGISLVVDNSVSSEAGSAYISSNASVSQSVKGYLSELAKQKNIILTHDERGNLVMTRAAVQRPVFDFDGSIPGVRYQLQVDGQQMYRTAHIVGQSDADGGNAREASITNPLVPGSVVREKTQTQSSGDDNDSGLAARNLLSAQLRGIKLTIEIDRWKLGGSVIRPGKIISVRDPELYLYNTTNFFIESVDLSLNSKQETATLTCVLPEVYTGETPTNIFAQ